MGAANLVEAANLLKSGTIFAKCVRFFWDVQRVCPSDMCSYDAGVRHHLWHNMPPPGLMLYRYTQHYSFDGCRSKFGSTFLKKALPVTPWASADN